LNVASEDVQAVSHAALRHRLVLNLEGEAGGISTKRLPMEALMSCVWRDGAFAPLFEKLANVEALKHHRWAWTKS
jgi:hypothetical protein